MKTVVIIPAYNEEKNIGRCLEEISQISEALNVCRIIVIDDGSTDQTSAIIQKYQSNPPVTVVRHASNLGVGQTFQDGFFHILNESYGADAVVTMEADNTSSLEILPQMLEKLDAGSDIVLASCYAPGGKIIGTNWYRIILSKIANLTVRILYPKLNVVTFSSFYRAYKLDFLRKLYKQYGDNLIKERGFACMVEILLKACRATSHISEVPMVLDTNKRVGASKMKILNTILGYARVVLRDKFVFERMAAAKQ